MAEENTGVDSSWRYIWGFILIVLCLFIGLSLFSYSWEDISLLKAPPTRPADNFIGSVGAWLSFGLFFLFGVGAYLVPVTCFLVALILFINRDECVWPRVVWSIVLMFSLSLATELYPDQWIDIRHRMNFHDTGGVVGRVIMRGLLIKWLQLGADIIVWALAAVSLIVLVEMRNFAKLGVFIKERFLVLYSRYKDMRSDEKGREREIEDEKRDIEKRRRQLEKVMKKERGEEKPKPAPAPAPARRPEPPPPKKKKKSFLGLSKKPKPAVKLEEPTGRSGPFQLPPISLLSEIPATVKGVASDTGITAKVLVETLSEFGIDVEVTNVEKGPVVTRYELLPAPGVKIERISGLANNLALALKATSVRVQAPIPGKGAVGIEVPNRTANMVCLRELIEGDLWHTSEAKLPLVLGKDVGGNDMIADLASMPHLLIAGATGAGKTVCMNSVLAGLLMSRTPDQMKLMLVDPKIVEFAVYNHLPHLVVPVITNPKKVAIGLRWAINEMEKRYKLFAKTGVRNIESYNNREVVANDDLFTASGGTEQKKDAVPATVPYIVIVIDELADLMLADQAEIENCVARLAQLSRAVGIHMILSTQRPSVNVITGTIKANFPARIAFQVAQKVDSRTILDTIGAEKLLGRGDMLFLPPGTSKVMRAQGAMTTDEEIQNITEFLKKQGAPDYALEIKEKIERNVSKLEEGEDDELLENALQIIRETSRASTSSLQRRLRIGYTRAARIMDILEERGIIGPPRGSDPREILVDLDEEIPNNMTEEPEAVVEEVDEPDDMEEAGETVEGESEEDEEQVNG